MLYCRLHAGWALPYVVEKDEEACSSSKPWAVKNKDTGHVYGCHTSKSDAEDQQAALYANTEAEAARAAHAEVIHMSRAVSAPVHVASLPTPSVVDQGNFNQDGISLVTVKDVPLMCVGMQFPASTGAVTFDFGDVDAAVNAHGDPTIPRPRVKLGHTDPRFNDCPCPHCGQWIEWGSMVNDAYMFDAMPNFGFLGNLSLQNEGAWVYADLVDVPEWLAKVMPVAYPSRSIEGWFNYTGLNMKEYKFIITDLALLGVVFPGCLNLADLPSMYGADTPTNVQFADLEVAA